MIFRAAGRGDGAAIAAFYVAVWRETYGRIAFAAVVVALHVVQRV